MTPELETNRPASAPAFGEEEGREQTDPATAPLMLELRGVGMCYRRRGGLLARRSRGFWAVRDLSLELRRGETLGIIGRNGAGKSTLLRLLAGITRPDVGEYVSHGYQATLLSLQVGFVQHLSGRENVMLSGLLLGLERREIEERMHQIVAFAELEEFIDQPIHTYSSGMRARLGFSTAFYVSPDILLIDEVLGVGDAAFVQKSKAVMRQKIASDATVVLVSHSVNAIRSLCDRVLWLERGRVRLEGSTAEVLAAYQEAVTPGPGKPPRPVSGAPTAQASTEAPSPTERREERREQRDLPAPPYLPPPLETGEGSAVEQAERTLSVGFARDGLPPFPIAPPVDWLDDPRDDRTWRFRLSSWSPLRPLFEAFAETRESRYADAARAFALDWIVRVELCGGGNDFVENRMSIGLRAAALAVLLDDALRRDEVPEQETTRLMEEAERLRDRLANPRRLIRYSNHGIFQLSGLLALVSTVPALDEDGDLRRYAVDNLAALYHRHFSPEGVHLEHSPAYHLAVVKQLGLLLASGWLGAAPELEELYRKGLAALVWMTHPDGTLARFGDTDLWRTDELLGSVGELGWDDPELRFAASGGRHGRPPGRRYVFFREGGLAAFRSPGSSPSDRWSFLVVSAAFHSATHKHADDLTFEWSERGRRLVVDSGKFAYAYDDPRRRYVESTRAHNTVEIDGADSSRAREDAFGSALRAAGDDGAGGFFCEALVERPAATHRRLLVLRPGRWLVVADRVTADREREVVQWLHLDPSIELSPVPGGAFAPLADGAGLLVVPIPVDGGPAPDLIHARGQEAPRLQGWISLEPNTLVPNDAVGWRARSESGWLITLLWLGHGDERPQAPAAVTSTEGRRSLGVRWTLAGREEGFDVCEGEDAPDVRTLT